MKITSLLIGVCLLPVLTGCHKPQTGEMIGAGEAAIKTAALASIAAKYPGIGSTDLKFSQINIRMTPDGKETIFVTYILPGSATTSMAGKKATTTTKAISVTMSPSGKIGTVSESTISEIDNAEQQ